METNLTRLRKAVDGLGGIITFDEESAFVRELTIILGEKVPLGAAKRAFIDVVDD